MNRSDIFDSYYKIAVEQGLTTKDSKEALDKNPRADSLSEELIQKLYGVKPEMIKGMEYEKCITEVAHPNSVVLFTAHEKLNGLLENDIERQNIILNQMKFQDPSFLKQKYVVAKQNLFRNLIAVANLLDDNNEDQLRKIADHCVEDQKKKLNKSAGWKMYLAGAAFAAIAPSLLSHLAPFSSSMDGAYEDVIADIKDITESETKLSTQIGFDYSYSDNLKSTCKMLEKYATIIVNSYHTLLKEIQNFTPEKQDIVSKFFTSFIEAVQNLENKLTSVRADFNDPGFRTANITQTGKIQKWIDSVPYLHNPQANQWNAFTNDFDELLKSFDNFLNQIKDFKTMMMEHYVKASKIEQSENNNDILKDNVTDYKSDNNIKVTVPSQKNVLNNIHEDKMMKENPDLMKQFQENYKKMVLK